MYNLRFPETWSGQIANITYKRSSPSIMTFGTILEKKFLSAPVGTCQLVCQQKV